MNVLCGFFCPLAPCIWIFLSEVLELFRDARSRCSIAKLSLAALSRRLVSLFFRHALVLAVALHRDALLRLIMIGCVPTNLGSFLLVSLFAVSVFASGIHTFAVFDLAFVF